LQAAVLVATRTAAAVLEEVVEELLERRAWWQLRHRAPVIFAAVAAAATLGLDGLRGGNIDHRIDHLFSDVGDPVGTARKRRCGERGNGGAKAERRQQRAKAIAQGWNRDGHVRNAPEESRQFDEECA
jgi:hypothetical protein